MTRRKKQITWQAHRLFFGGMMMRCRQADDGIPIPLRGHVLVPNGEKDGDRAEAQSRAGDKLYEQIGVAGTPSQRARLCSPRNRHDSTEWMTTTCGKVNSIGYSGK
jgi:hypothetical protein